MNYHVHKWAVQRETVHLPDAKALKAKSGLTGGTCGGASLIIDTKGRDAGMAHQTGRDSRPLSERCCLEFVRPSHVDGGCHPEGRRADSIAPSAAQRNRLSQASQVRNGARDHRTGWRATECATFAALDPHRGAV